MTFGDLRSLITEVFPQGQPENLIAVHDRYFVEALYDLQKNISCLQANNVDVIPQCGSYFQCGMTVLPAPRGRILSVSVIDKIDPYTGLESADADDDWCNRVYYSPVAYCHLASYSRLCERCSGSLASSLNAIVSSIFGIFRTKRRYPEPTDEGFESLAPLQQGFHYPQSSTDAEGRSPSGFWADYRGRIYIGPWIQSTETVVIEWNGIKRNWSDADLVDDDPKFIQAVLTHVKWQHEKNWGDKELARELEKDLWGTPQTTGTIGLIPDLIHECHEEQRRRACDEAMGAGTSGGGARGMAPTSTTTGGTGTIYYNERQSYTASCPNGQTGDSVTVVKEAGTVQSVLSVADANAQAQSAAQSEANSRLICEDAGVSYLNVAQTYTANCPAATEDTPAADGNPVTVTIPAGSYSSNVSQQAADDAALAAAQANAEAQLACTYWNEEQTYTAECPTGTAGADVTKTIAAHTFSSTLSQGDANAKALAEAQNTAQAELSCGSTAYMIGNTPQSSMFSLECPGCIRFPIVHASAVVPSNTYQMLTTPANAVADQLSLNQAAKSLAQIQAEANAHAICNLCSLEHNPV